MGTPDRPYRVTPGRIVVVGASLAGGRAAETLRADGFDGEIVLIGDEPHRPYERPPLSKEILRGDWPDDKAFLRPDDYYAEVGIELLLGARATAIDTAAKTVALAEGSTVPYDALLIATGGRPRALPVPGSDLDGVLTLRTIGDAHAIRDRLTAGARVAVVGAGFIGCEVAASARALGCDVTIVEVFSTVLERALGAEVGRAVEALHRDNGVRMLFEVGAERFEGDGRVERIALADGRAVDADVVVVGVGMVPNDELARAAGIACEDGVVVDERCRTSAEGVYAAGDVANHPNPIVGERIRIEHWQNAQNQGAAAARAILGGTEPFAEVPWFWSDQYDATIQMFGHPAGWDRIVFRGDVGARAFAAYYLRDGRLLASASIGRTKDARAVKPLIERGAAVDPDALADEATDLRALAKA